MALDGITTDHSGMARAQRVRHAKPLSGLRIADVMDLHLKVAGLQVRNPLLAAAAVRVFPNFDLRTRLGQCPRGDGRYGKASVGLKNMTSLHEVCFSGVDVSGQPR